MISLVGDQAVTCLLNADCVRQHGAAQYDDSLLIEVSVPFPSEFLSLFLQLAARNIVYDHVNFHS
jgi:hypothetical protein